MRKIKEQWGEQRYQTVKVIEAKACGNIAIQYSLWLSDPRWRLQWKNGSVSFDAINELLDCCRNKYELKV